MCVEGEVGGGGSGLIIFFIFCPICPKNYKLLSGFFFNFAELKWIRGISVLQIKVFLMTGGFFSEHSKTGG